MVGLILPIHPSFPPPLAHCGLTLLLFKDVLASCGLPAGRDAAAAAGVKHVIFYGADGMQASVPAHKACVADSEVLLAYEMNGRPLLPHTGAPVRAVVPGVIGGAKRARMYHLLSTFR